MKKGILCFVALSFACAAVFLAVTHFADVISAVVAIPWDCLIAFALGATAAFISCLVSKWGDSD